MNLNELRCGICKRLIGWITDEGDCNEDDVYCSKDCASMDNNT